MMGSQGKMTKNYCYEESLLVPFIIRWPGKIPATKDNLLLSIPDIMPTLLELIGFEDVIPKNIDGKSYAPIFLGKDQKRPDFALYLKMSIGNYKGGRRGLRTNKYTFVIEKGESGEKREYRLYDNENDPYQLENIADKKPDLVNNLRERLNKRLKEIDDPDSKL